MNNIEYANFIQKKGRSMSEINPGSNEWALKIDDALEAIELLKDTAIVILGGDVIFEEKGKLSFGSESWHVDKKKNENQQEFTTRSHEESKKYVYNIKNWAVGNVYVVIAIRESLMVSDLL